jgi:hypothetical protein
MAGSPMMIWPVFCSQLLRVLLELSVVVELQLF